MDLCQATIAMFDEFDPLTNPGKTFTNRFGKEDDGFKSPGEYITHINKDFDNIYGDTFPSANYFADSSMFDTFGEANTFNALESGFIPLENLFG